jgi:hypothetical protein
VPAILRRSWAESQETEPVVSSSPALSKPRLFYGWFVVAAVFAVTFVGFGIA